MSRAGVNGLVLISAGLNLLAGSHAEAAAEAPTEPSSAGVAAVPVMREPTDKRTVGTATSKSSNRNAEAHLGALGKPVGVQAENLLNAGMEERAAGLAHYAAALQAEVEGDMRRALVHYREVLRSGVEDADLVRRAVALEVRHGSPETAEAMLKERMKAQPGRPGPALQLVEFLDAYLSGKKAETQADQLVEEIRALFPHNEEVITTAVIRRLVKGDRESAAMVMRKAAEWTDGDAAYWLALAGVAQEVWPLGQSEASEKHRAEVNVYYERALQAARQSQDRERELEVAQYYVLSNQLDLAKGVCERMAAKSGDLTARKILYRLYESEELTEKAFALLEGIVRDDPKDVSQRRLLAEVLEKRQQFPEAARQLEAAIQVGAGTAGDYEKLTNLWLGLLLPDKALTLVLRAMRLFPDTPGFQAQAAMAYAAKKDFPRAIDAFAEAEKLAGAGGADVFNHRFYFRFGVVLEQADRHQEAADQLRRSIEMTPETDVEFRANTMNYLGYMWIELGQNLDEAEKWIVQALQQEPSNPAYIDSMGWLLHKQGRHEEALVELLRAESLLKELEPGDAEILEHIAVVLEAQGKKAESLETLKRAADLRTPDEAVADRILDGLKRLEDSVAN